MRSTSPAKLTPSFKVRKILFIRIDRIGDLVLSLPAITAIKRRFIGCELTLLASSSNASLLYHHPDIDRIAVYDRSKTIAGRCRDLLRLRRSGFDLSIDPFIGYEMESAVVSLLIGAVYRLGVPIFDKDIFFNIAATCSGSGQHFIDQTLDVLKPLKINDANRIPKLYLNEEEISWRNIWLHGKGFGRKPIIAIHPGANYLTQRWLPERFVELISAIKKETSVDLILFSGPSEDEVVRRILSRLGFRIQTFKTSSLRRFIALLSACDLMVCNNSGPLHIAVALNTATVSTMGPTVKERWLPLGDRHRVLRYDTLPCIGCNSGVCLTGTHACMGYITVEMMMKEVQKLLSVLSGSA